MRDVLSLNLIGKYKSQLMVHAALQDITVGPPMIIAYVLIALTSEPLSKVSSSLFSCSKPSRYLFQSELTQNLQSLAGVSKMDISYLA